MVIKIRYLNRYFLEFMYYIVSKNPISTQDEEKETVYISEKNKKDVAALIINAFPPKIPPKTIHNSPPIIVLAKKYGIEFTLLLGNLMTYSIRVRSQSTDGHHRCLSRNTTLIQF